MTQTVSAPGLIISDAHELAVVAEVFSYFTYEDLVAKVKSIEGVTPITAKQFEAALAEILSALSELGVIDNSLQLTESYRV